MGFMKTKMSENIEGIPSQEQGTIDKAPSALTPKTKKLVIGSIVVLVLVVLFVLFIAGNTTKKQSGQKTPIITPPYFVVTATPPLQPSRWASDAGVLKIEKDVNVLDNGLTNIDLNEPVLSLPNIDTHVTFQK